MFKIKGLATWIMFAAIIMVFALFGVGQRNTSTGAGGYAAIVDGQVVSLLEVQKRYENALRGESQKWRKLPSAQRQKKRDELRGQVVQSLVDAEVASQSAADLGMRVSDHEIRDWIVEIPAFQEGGIFQPSFYERYLQSVGSSAVKFEAELRRNRNYENLRDLFLQSLVPSELGSDKKTLAENTKLNISFIKFDTTSLTSSYKISDKELNKYMGSSKQEISEYFEKNKEDYKTKEQTRARHILIKAVRGDDKSFEAALTKIKKIAERAKKEDFGKLAMELSEDPGSKAKSGDLGYFERGRMVKEFESVAFSSPVGKVSPPVKTAYGYHLIKVEDRKGGGYKELPEVSNEIARKLYVENRIKDQIESLRLAVKEGRKGKIKSLSSQFGLKWVDSGEFNLSTGFIPKLGENKKVYEAALALKSGEMAAELIESDGQFYLIRSKSFSQKPAKTVKLEQNDYFKDFMKYQKAQLALKGWIEGKKKTAKIRINEQFFQ